MLRFVERACFRGAEGSAVVADIGFAAFAMGVATWALLDMGCKHSASSDATEIIRIPKQWMRRRCHEGLILEIAP